MATRYLPVCLLLAVLSLSSQATGKTIAECAEAMNSGLTPCKYSWFAKSFAEKAGLTNIFKVACQKHATCYKCGKKYDWSRFQCDDAFRTEMKTACKDLKSVKSDDVTDSKKLELAESVGKSLSKMLVREEGTYDYCKAGVQVLYKSVRIYSYADFQTNLGGDCNSACIPILLKKSQ